MWPPIQNSKVTVELREVIESGVDIWDFEYPSYYKGDAKRAFEQKVIDHFWLRQIGAETVGRFLHYFRRTVREIMPLYIQRYESVDLMKDPEIRPLDNYNMIEEFEREEDSETNSDSTGSRSQTSDTSRANSSTTEGTHATETLSKSTDKVDENTTGASSTSGKETEVHSDTPQGTLNISIPAYPLGQNTAETISHASDVTQKFNGAHTSETRDTSRDGTSNAEANVSGSSSETFTDSGSETFTDSESSEGSNRETVKGKQTQRLTRRGNIGVTTYAQLLEGYRQTFLNIDMEIIEELDSCFLGVF